MKQQLEKTTGLRERVLKSRPSNPRPPRSLYRRYQVDQATFNGRSVFTLSPRGRAAQTHVLYLHGGAYVYEMIGAQWKMIGRLVDRANVTVTVPLYPLAPESTCEQVLSFVLELYREVLERAGTQPLVLFGDSAGGGLALSLSQLLRDSGARQAAQLVLLSPWLDVTCSDPDQLALDKVDPLLALPGLREEGLWYAGDLSPADPRVSPIHGAVEDLPPVLLLTGTRDLLNPDAHRLHEKMIAAGAALKMVEYKDMLHVWPAMPIPEAQQAMDEIVSFIGALALSQ